MGTLTHGGLVVPSDREIKSELTVRPVENGIGIRPPSFKVYRTSGDTMVVPRYYGLEKLGPPAKDARGSPHHANISFNGTLRAETHQLRAFDAGIKAFEEKGGGVLSLAPGFGKTTIALAFSAHLKMRTIIIVHKEFLANQWKERIQQFCPGATIGRIQQDVFDIEKDFVIAMIQTLCMREVGSLDKFGLLIVDEAHHIGAAAFSQSMFKLCPRYTLGLTATPERKDGLTRVLYWFMGPSFYTFQRENERKTKVETIYYDDELYKTCPPTNKFGKVSMPEMVTLISELNSRNELILDIVKNCLGNGRRVLILSDRREQCLWFNSQFQSEISGLYMGGMSESSLNESAKKKVIVATFAMAQEGLDIPVLDTCVLTSPHSDVTQAVGRIMRETAGKTNSPLIYDIVDKWSLFYAMYNKRLAFYKKAGFQCKDSTEPTSKKRPLEEGRCAFL